MGLRISLEAAEYQWVAIEEAIEEHRERWEATAEESGWLDAWEDNGKRLQVWVRTETLEVVDSIYINHTEMEDDVVVLRTPEFEGG